MPALAPFAALVALLLAACGRGAEPVRLGPVVELPGDGPRDHLALAVAPDGRWLAAYESAPARAPKATDVVVVAGDLAGGTGAPVVVSRTPGATHPQLARLADGWAACWDEEGGHVVRLARLNDAGRVVGEAIAVRGGEVHVQSYCDLAAHDDGTVTMLWQGHDPARTVRPGSWTVRARPGDPAVVREAFPAVGPVATDALPDGSAVLAWTAPEAAGEPPRVRLAAVDAEGAVVRGPIAVPDSEGAVRPDVVAGPDGGLVVAWSSDPSGAGPWWVRLDAAWRPVGAPEALATRGGGPVALGAAGSLVAVTWATSTRERVEAHLSVRGFDGTVIAADEVIATWTARGRVRPLGVVELVPHEGGARGLVGWQAPDETGVRSLFVRTVAIPPVPETAR